MLMVKTTIKPSTIEGLGLFATQLIPKGTTVWQFNPHFDIFFDPEDVKLMASLQQELMNRYAYLSTESGKYVYCIDDSRFMNHSSVHNNLDVVQFPGELETRGVANRDIQTGEEILINYKTFDAADATGSEEYLKH